MTNKRISLVFIGIVFLVLGFVIGRITASTDTEKTVDLLLYGEESAVIETLDADIAIVNPIITSPLFQAVQGFISTAILQAPVSSDRKFLLLNYPTPVIQSTCIFLALGSIGDADVTIRNKCVEELESIIENGITVSLSTIDRTLYKEEDPNLLAKKKELLRKYYQVQHLNETRIHPKVL